MAEKLTKICNQFGICQFSDIPIVREKFCYQGGGCPETYYPIIKELIRESLGMGSSSAAFKTNSQNL